MALIFTLYAGLGDSPVQGNAGPLNYANISKRSHDNGIALRGILKDSEIEGYTLVEGTGFYGGQAEPCAIVTVICVEPGQAQTLKGLLLQVAENYKRAARQEEVWITQRIEDLLIV